MKYILLITLVLALHWTIASATQSRWKRQEVASATCGQQPNSVAICSPSTNETWYNGTYQEFTWNYNNAAFTDSATVDLYLLYESNGTYNDVKVWYNLSRTSGVLVSLVDDSWFPSQLPDNSPNKTWYPYAYMLAPGFNYQEEIDKLATKSTYFPAPVQFILIQNAHNTTNNTVFGPNNTDNSNSNSNESSSFKPWMIAVIVVVCVLFLAACAAVFWLVRRLRRSKAATAAAAATTGGAGEQKTLVDDEPSNSPTSTGTVARNFQAGSVTNASSTGGDMRDMSSIHSSTPIVAHGGSLRGSPVTQSPSTTKSINDPEKAPSFVPPHIMQHSEARGSSSILSSTDALMIADTFRQFMRKPEWNDQHEEEEEEEEGGIGAGFKASPQQQQPESNPTHLGEELLRKELAEEGTPVQNVGHSSSSTSPHS